MNIYLAAKIAGGNNLREEVKSIARELEARGHHVLTPFVYTPELNAARFPGVTGIDRANAIMEEDKRLLREADIFILEVTNDSTGGGFEYGYVAALNDTTEKHRAILKLRHESARETTVGMLTSSNIHGDMVYYDRETIPGILDSFFANIESTRETGSEINKERGN